MSRRNLPLSALLGALWLTACAHTEPTPAPAPAPAATPAPAPAPAAAIAKPPEPQKLAGEEAITHQPAPGPLGSFDAPVPQVTTLPNGLRIYVVERPKDGIEALELVVRRGSVTEPPGQEGLASLTAAMLEAGSAGRTQAQLAAAADAIGAELSVTPAQDSTFVSVSAMPTRLDAMVKLLSDVALRPNFDPGEWTRLKGRREAELLARRAQPLVAAGLAFGYAEYGNTPLGHPTLGTPESVKAITLDQVKGFYAAFSPRDSAIIAVGGAPQAAVVAAIQRAFGGWKPGRPAPTPAQVLAQVKLPEQRPRLVMVDFPGKPQSVLRVGQPAVPRSSPDYLALRLLNSILGGSFTSRLNQNLREAHGYTYGAGSGFLFGTGPGPFLVFSSVKTEVTGDALKEVMGELQRAVATPLTPAEMEKGKALLAFELVQEIQYSTGAAGAMAQLFVYDLPLDWYRRFVPDLKALTAESVQAAARRVLAPDAMSIVIAGDVGKVKPQLEPLKLPAPQMRDAGGQLIGKP